MLTRISNLGMYWVEAATYKPRAVVKEEDSHALKMRPWGGEVELGFFKNRIKGKNTSLPTLTRGVK
jgi:hypothetical protein